MQSGIPYSYIIVIILCFFELHFLHTLAPIRVYILKLIIWMNGSMSGHMNLFNADTYMPMKLTIKAL